MTHPETLTDQPSSVTRRSIALAYGVLCHITFIFSVSLMIWSLYHGLLFGIGPWHGWIRLLANFLLAAQFPLLHSFLLSPRGRPILNTFAPSRFASVLQPTTYVLIASFQLAAVFILWSPPVERFVLWQPHGVLLGIHTALYVSSWLLLGKSMWDAHLGIQTGYIGWFSLWRGETMIRWPSLPTSGLFRICRQPIYFSFMLTLWTGPTWTFDKLFLASIWTCYCYWGPYLKELRLERSYGETFKEFKRNVSYWPSFKIGRNTPPIILQSFRSLRDFFIR